MRKSAFLGLFSLIALPGNAQELAPETVLEQDATEQPMGGIGVSAEFARTHIPRSRMHPMMVVELFTDQDSRVVDCAVLYPEDLVAEESFYCRRPIGKRTGFAAIGPDGNAAYGVGRVHIRTGSPDWQTAPADLEIVVSDLPGEIERHNLTVMAYIDESGRLRNCQRASGHPAYSLVACQQAAGHSFAVREGADGGPVAYVANLSVAFLTED